MCIQLKKNFTYKNVYKIQDKLELNLICIGVIQTSNQQK
jgi:hypothetical protein